MIRSVLATAATAVLAGTGTAHAGVHRHVLGHSVDGRAIVAYELGDPASARTVLVVGCLHGNEPAGTAVTTALARLVPPAGVDLWFVPSFNPDGQAAGTRGNAHGVDLNRNFPWRWRPLHGVYDSGPRPLSEPESRIVHTLLLRLRPAISIWFHQHLDVVDVWATTHPPPIFFLRSWGLPPAPLPLEPASFVT